MSDQLFKCGLCEKLTPLIRKTDRLPGDINYEYAECVKCKGKTTILYTNKKIRGLLAKQRKTPPGNLKLKLAERINEEMANLAKEME